MAVALRQLFSNGKNLSSRQLILFSTSSVNTTKWRYQTGRDSNTNRFGPLTNLPDYSFVDGRQVPITPGLYKKLKLQEEYCKRIVQLSNELDYAVERHQRMEEEKEEKKKLILKSKLKPKGIHLLKQNSNIAEKRGRSKRVQDPKSNEV